MRIGLTSSSYVSRLITFLFFRSAAVAVPPNVGVPLAVAALENVIGCLHVIDTVDDLGRAC